jgi:hypothetical protein
MCHHSLSSVQARVVRISPMGRTGVLGKKPLRLPSLMRPPDDYLDQEMICICDMSA